MNLLGTSNWLYMHMPIAGLNIFWPGVVLIGFAGGMIDGFFGVGGAWMVTPGLNILGFPMSFAIAGDLAHLGGKSILSTIRHSKFGSVDFKLGFVMFMGSIAGIELSAQLVMFLEQMGTIGSVVRRVYLVFLALMASVAFYEYSKARRVEKEGPRSEHGEVIRHGALRKIRIPPMMTFETAEFRCSLWLPVSVGFITGSVSGFLGMGGGLLCMLGLVYLIGCPTKVALGTVLFEAMISGLYGAFTYSLKGRIDIVAVFVLLTGAAVGAQFGTVAAKYGKGYGIRLAVGAAIVCCMISVVLKEFKLGAIAAALILGAMALLCLYIIKILFQGVMTEIREKKMERYSAPATRREGGRSAFNDQEVPFLHQSFLTSYTKGETRRRLK